jgi:5-methylthioadenosine/S-adenosylhomocysteine deaminase
MRVLAGGLFDGQDVFGPSTLVCEHGRVARLEPGWSTRDGPVVDLSARFVLPAFVNAHSHLAMTLLRGYGEDLPLERWLSERILPAEDLLTPEDVYWGALAALAEAIRSGTGTVADMYMHMDAVAEAVLQSGARALLARGLVGSGEAFAWRLHEAIRLHERWHGADGRVQVWFGPHAPYSCPPPSLAEAVAQARARGVGLHIHLLETADEAERCRAQHGHTPLALLDRLGAGHLPILAAHMVHPTEEDWAALPRLSLAVVTCPVSNMALASGLAPLALYRGRLPLALGTDGAAPAGGLDMYVHLKALRWAEKSRSRDAAALPAGEVLALATAGGGEALRWPGLGRLAPGSPADFQAVDLEDLAALPVYEPLATLASAGSGALVTDLFVAGRPLLRDGAFVTLDARAIAQRVRAIPPRRSQPRPPSRRRGLGARLMAKNVARRRTRRASRLAPTRPRPRPRHEPHQALVPPHPTPPARAHPLRQAPGRARASVARAGSHPPRGSHPAPCGGGRALGRRAPAGRVGGVPLPVLPPAPGGAAARRAAPRGGRGACRGHRLGAADAP